MDEYSPCREPLMVKFVSYYMRNKFLLSKELFPIKHTIQKPSSTLRIKFCSTTYANTIVHYVPSIIHYTVTQIVYKTKSHNQNVTILTCKCWTLVLHHTVQNSLTVDPWGMCDHMFDTPTEWHSCHPQLSMVACTTQNQWLPNIQIFIIYSRETSNYNTHSVNDYEFVYHM